MQQKLHYLGSPLCPINSFQRSNDLVLEGLGLALSAGPTHKSGDQGLLGWF
jgi:hypothetical protein